MKRDELKIGQWWYQPSNNQIREKIEKYLQGKVIGEARTDELGEYIVKLHNDSFNN